MQPTRQEQQSAPRNGGAPPKYPHVKRMTDRHGRQRLYFRPRRNLKGIALPTPEGSPDFVRAYALALAGIKDRESGVDRANGKTWDAAIAGWQSTGEYRDNRPNTIKSHKYPLAFISEIFGSLPVAAMTADQLRSIIDAKAEVYPGAARVLLSCFRGPIRYAIRKGWRTDDPSLAIEKPKRGGTHHQWTDNEVAQYRRRHPVGSIARLAVEILYCTGLRRIDATLIGYEHVTSGEARDAARQNAGAKPGPNAHVPD